VRVRFHIDGQSIELNDPLIYQKDLDTVWGLVWSEDDPADPRQKDMLCPLGFGPDQYYGYCGLNLGNHYEAALKSVGGVVTRERHNPSDPIVGIAEYAVSAASRRPSRLAVPDHVMQSWVEEQTKRVLGGKLTDEQREAAAANLGKLVNDIRPIFYVRTSEGGINLDDLISTIGRVGRFNVPVYVHKLSPSHMHFSGHPLQMSWPGDDFVGEFYFEWAEINFDSPTAFSPLLVGSLIGAVDADSRIIPRTAPNVYTDFWSVVLKTLDNLHMNFELTYRSKFKVGTYKGLDSPKHNIKTGDDILFDVVQITIV
jgi:hypothetical protein